MNDQDPFSAKPSPPPSQHTTGPDKLRAPGQPGSQQMPAAVPSKPQFAQISSNPLIPGHLSNAHQPSSLRCVPCRIIGSGLFLGMSIYSWTLFFRGKPNSPDRKLTGALGIAFGILGMTSFSLTLLSDVDA